MESGRFRLLKIPKDLSTREMRFYESMPVILKGKVEPEKWRELMNGFNKIFEQEDGWKIINVFRLAIPFLGIGLC